VSITLNSDLYPRQKKLGINAFEGCRRGACTEYSARRSEALAGEIRDELAALERFEAAARIFPELVRGPLRARRWAQFDVS